MYEKKFGRSLLIPMAVQGISFLMLLYLWKTIFRDAKESVFWWIILAVVIANGIFYYEIWKRERKKLKKRLDDLTKYLELVNTGNASVLTYVEDECSHLEDEIFKTVSSLYQMKEAAVAAKKNYADNLANIAHQLKTPIACASLSVQLMERNYPNVYGEQIKKQLHRLDQLEEALLLLSKIDAGTLQMKKEEVDIYTVLNLAAENLDDLLRERNISIDIPDQGCVQICGDLEWTMEALINVMKNCMEHSPDGGVISCTYAANPLYVEIRIWDEGDGFLEEDIPHLFERFYRGSRMQGSGIGIGLALAKSIFALENGTITAKNLPEHGACFEIHLYSH